MLYLASSTTPAIKEAMTAGQLGRLSTRSSNPPRGEVWAADNECYSKPTTFDLDVYCTWLSAFDAATKGRCLFATCPDVVGDAAATFERSNAAADAIAATGIRPALVLQDGMTPADIEWGLYGAVFVGGTTEWKLSEPARTLVREAAWRGLWTHMGRVNSLERCRVAHRWRIGSVDGTYLSFGPDTNLPKLLGWFATLKAEDAQGVLI